MGVKTGRHVERTDAQRELATLARPFQQGSLDCYCGLYAVVNAMLRLRPEAFIGNEEGASDVFYAMIKAAARMCSPEELCGVGMNSIELEYAAKAGIKRMRRSGYAFKLLAPAQVPLNASIEDIGRWLIAAQAQTSLAVILYIEQSDSSHWSVLKSVRGRRVTLFDSDRMTYAALGRCEPAFVLKAVV